MTKTRKTVLCFGDSLTWGWVPVAGDIPSERYPPHIRWTGVLQSELGQSFTVIEEGLSGRTTDYDDPNDERLNGSQYLPSALASHLPLDLVIIMLGTNDTKSVYNRTPMDIAYGMSKLIGQVSSSAGGVASIYSAPKCLVVAPPALKNFPGAFVQQLFEGADEKSVQIASLYKDLSEFHSVEYFDAGSVISDVGSDGIHFSAENNNNLGKALAQKTLEICA